MKSGILAWGGAFCVLAMAAAPALAEDTVAFSAKLDGASQPTGGDPKGSGAFTGEIDPETGDLCYTLKIKDIATPTMAHLHKGTAGSDGDVVVKLNITGNDGDECSALQREVAKAIVADPGSYYVNVHTADYPKGAIRGQLTKVAKAAP